MKLSFRARTALVFAVVTTLVQAIAFWHYDELLPTTDRFGFVAGATVLTFASLLAGAAATINWERAAGICVKLELLTMVVFGAAITAGVTAALASGFNPLPGTMATVTIQAFLGFAVGAGVTYLAPIHQLALARR